MKVTLEVVLELQDGHTITEAALRNEVIEAIMVKADADEDKGGPLAGVTSVQVSITGSTKT